MSIFNVGEFKTSNIHIYFATDSKKTDLIKNKFYIRSANLQAQISEKNQNNQKIYSLRDSEKNIKDIDYIPVNLSKKDKLPNIIFEEIGEFPYLEANNKIKIISPFNFEDLSSEDILTKVDNFLLQNKIFSNVERGIEDNIIILTVKEDYSQTESFFEVPNFLLQFDYPDQAFIDKQISFIVIKEEYQKEDNINFETLDGKISLSSGQPIFNFAKNEDFYKEFIINNTSDTLPPIKIIEDKLINSLTKGKVITFLIDADFDAIWDDTNLQSTPSNIFAVDNNNDAIKYEIDKNNNKAISLELIRDIQLGEEILIKGLRLRILNLFII